MRGYRPALLTTVSALLLAGGLTPAGAAARTDAPVVPGPRCVPATKPVWRPRPQVQIGKQVQLRGRNLKAGMRVSFRWSRGALATKLRHSSVGFVVRVPAGTKPGTVTVRVPDRAGRHSQTRLIVLPAPVVRPPVQSTGGALPHAVPGGGLWSWGADKEGGGAP